jgi:hypothetical protein
VLAYPEPLAPLLKVRAAAGPPAAGQLDDVHLAGVPDHPKQALADLKPVAPLPVGEPDPAAQVQINAPGKPLFLKDRQPIAVNLDCHRSNLPLQVSLLVYNRGGIVTPSEAARLLASLRKPKLLVCPQCGKQFEGRGRRQ